MKGISGRRTSAVLLIGLIGSAVFALSRASGASDQTELESLVSQVEKGFEAKAPATVMGYIASDYHDAEGLDREDVSRIVNRLGRGTHSVDITIQDQQIEVKADRAAGRFDVLAVVVEGEDRITWPMKLQVEFARKRTAWWLPWHKQWVIESVKGHSMRAWLDEI